MFGPTGARPHNPPPQPELPLPLVQVIKHIISSYSVNTGYFRPRPDSLPPKPDVSVAGSG